MDTEEYVVPTPSTLKLGLFNYFVKARTSAGCESSLINIVVKVGNIRKPEIQWINYQLQSDSGYNSYEWIADEKLVAFGGF